MRKNLCLFFIAGFVGFIFSANAFAQVAAADSSSQQNAYNNAKTQFYAAIGNQSRLYNGPEYYFYDPHIKGNAYFMDVNTFNGGSVYYDGTLYNNALMMYDLYSDKVAVLLYNHFSKYSLVKEKVQYFDLLDHHFVNIGGDTLSAESPVKAGYYEELYKGKHLQVLVKRAKSIQNSSGGTLAAESFFSPTIDYYIRKDKVYHSISSQGGILDMLKDKKKELQQYIKANSIKFRREPEDAMVKIAYYYDHLTNN